MTWELGVTLFGAVLAVLVPYLTFRRSGQSDRNKRLDDLEKKFHALEDYTYQLRRDLADAGQTVRPWPSELGGHV